MARPVLELPELTVSLLRTLAAQQDPRELATYLAALAEAGWGYQPAATALDLHRETVRHRAQTAPQGAVTTYPVPERPPRPEKASPPVLTEAQVERLKELNKLAKTLRGPHDKHHPARRASESLSKLIDELVDQGHTYREIGVVLGVKAMTVRARLKRHGYRKTNPTLTPYAGYRPDREEAPA